MHVIYGLPTELWMNIFSFASNVEWRVLAETCRLFRALAEIRLYSAIHIWSLLTGKDNRNEPSPRAVATAQTLAARPELCLRVRTLRVCAARRYFRPSGGPYLDTFSDHFFLREFGLFDGLKTVSLTFFRIDEECYAALCALPSLERLHLELCGIEPNLAPTAPRRKGCLRELSIRNARNTLGWAALVWDGLETLAVDATSQPPMFLVSLIRAVLRNRAHQTLRTFEWTPRRFDASRRHPPALYVLLEKCTELRKIQMRQFGAEDFSCAGCLPARVLPLLDKYEGPAEHVGAFACGRPVRSVALVTTEQTSADALAGLSLATVPVRRVKLLYNRSPRIKLPDLGRMLEYAPATLHSVFLGGTYTEEQLRSWLPILARNEELYTIRMYEPQQIAQRYVVGLLAEACPSLRRVRFHVGSAYTGSLRCLSTWTRREDGDWEFYPVPQC